MVAAHLAARHGTVAASGFLPSAEHKMLHIGNVELLCRKAILQGLPLESKQGTLTWAFTAICLPTAVPDGPKEYCWPGQHWQHLHQQWRRWLAECTPDNRYSYSLYASNFHFQEPFGNHSH
jgi:hypothetical protein